MDTGKLWKRLTISSLALVLIMLCGIIVVYYWSSTTVVLLVRHAERNDAIACTAVDTACVLPNSSPANPVLSVAGETRAATLAHVGEDAGLQTIYASCFCRTQQTVQPIATNLGLAVKNVSQHAADGSPDVDALVTQIKTDNDGQRVLVAGHSDTVPLIIEKLGGGTIDPITGSEFDNLYVVTIVKWWFLKKRVRVVRLKYGVPT